MSAIRKAIQFQLKCKNGCGFYGNPEWQGYCSKCHRELNQQKKAEKKPKKVQRSYSDAHESTLGLRFSKFEEKKTKQADKRSNTFRSIIKRAPTLKDQQSPSRDITTTDEINQFIKQMKLKDPIAKDIIKHVQKQLDIFTHLVRDKSIDETSDMMQDFYNSMVNRCETHELYSDVSSEQIEQLMDKMEEQLMKQMHSLVFLQISSEYEEKDLALQKRIRSLNWISFQHLGINITQKSPEVADLIDKAISDVIAMDSKIAPQEKMRAIVECSKTIFDLINLGQGITVSADEFLPTMVYIVLKGNPPRLHSNMKYITSYSIPARLRSGEGAYYFTNLCCAVAFIEDMNSESLNMSEDEFQRYISGEIPPSSVDRASLECEGLRAMSKNLASLNEIEEKYNIVMNEMLLLKNDMVKFEENIRKSRPSPPFVPNEKPYSVSANTDMSLIPEILRHRITFQPVEDILIEIDCKTKILEDDEQETDSYAQDLSGISLGPDPNSNVSQLQGLQVSLPLGSGYFQPEVNLTNVEYPTDLLPAEDSVEFGPFEGCTLPEPVIATISSSANHDEVDLPPPLEPIVNYSDKKV